LKSSKEPQKSELENKRNTEELANMS